MDIEKIAEFSIVSFIDYEPDANGYRSEIGLKHNLCGHTINTRSAGVAMYLAYVWMCNHECPVGPSRSDQGHTATRCGTPWCWPEGEAEQNRDRSAER